jgi:ABC-2 type transport system permease protein
MSAFLFGVGLQWKLDLRNRGILLTYYLVPLVFFAFMSGIFSSINPAAKETLIQSMTIFGVTMGAILGASAPLVDLYGSEIKKAYKMGGIPLWVATVNNFISAFIHLYIMSLIIFFLAPIFFDASVPEKVGVYFISLGIFIIASLGIGTVLGLLVKSSSRLTLVAQFVFLPSIMLGGIMFQAELLPKAFTAASVVFPATWGFKLMTTTTLEFSFILPLLVILVFSGVVIGIRLKRIGLE